MRYDVPTTLAPGMAGVPGAAGVELRDLPVRQQLKHGLKDMGRSAWSSAKNFGMIGAIFAGTECCIEGV